MSSDPQEIPPASGYTTQESHKDLQGGEATSEGSISQKIPTAAEETSQRGDSQEISKAGEESTGSGDPQPPEHPPASTSSATTRRTLKLCMRPDRKHIPENYDDPELEFTSEVLSSLEMYLPRNMLTLNRDEKAKILSDILRKYICRENCTWLNTINSYKQEMNSGYRLHYPKLHEFQARNFIVPPLQEAIRENTEESFRHVIAEPSPGVFVFPMLQPEICDLLLTEVDHYKSWAVYKDLAVRRASDMHEYSVVLDDFGLDSVLKDLINRYIHPLAKVFFPELDGAKFDSHHGFIVEFAEYRNSELVTHVDESEVTLNVCLSDNQFEGGELYFRGTRCAKHENTDAKLQELYEYAHAPGQAVLYRGRNRHGNNAMTSGRRTDMILWCQSFRCRDMRTTYMKEDDIFRWCGTCKEEATEKQQKLVCERGDDMLVMIDRRKEAPDKKIGRNEAQVNTTQFIIVDQPEQPEL